MWFGVYLGMETIYGIQMSEGEYEDNYTYIVKAFRNEELAIKYVTKYNNLLPKIKEHSKVMYYKKQHEGVYYISMFINAWRYEECEIVKIPVAD